MNGRWVAHALQATRSIYKQSNPAGDQACTTERRDNYIGKPVAPAKQNQSNLVRTTVWTEYCEPQVAITGYKNGIVTRGALIDIPRLKNIPFLETGTAMYPEDLDAWGKKQEQGAQW